MVLHRPAEILINLIKKFTYLIVRVYGHAYIWEEACMILIAFLDKKALQKGSSLNGNNLVLRK